MSYRFQEQKLKQLMLEPGGGGGRTFRGLLLPSQGCSWKRLKWLGENIKPWIENRATSRHSTVNLGLVLLHKFFCIYMTKIRAFWFPDSCSFFKGLGRYRFPLYVLKTYDKKCFFIALVSQNTVGFLDLRPQKPTFIIKIFIQIETIGPP